MIVGFIILKISVLRWAMKTGPLVFKGIFWGMTSPTHLYGDCFINHVMSHRIHVPYIWWYRPACLPWKLGTPLRQQHQDGCLVGRDLQQRSGGGIFLPTVVGCQFVKSQHDPLGTPTLVWQICVHNGGLGNGPRCKAQRAIRTWMASTAQGDNDGLPRVSEACGAPASRCFVACGHGLCQSCLLTVGFKLW